MALLDAIQHWADVSPETIAHVSGDRSLTYGELARRSDRFADYLLRTFTPDQRCRPLAFYGHKEPELLIGFLGAVKSGHPYIPIDVATPPQRIGDVMQISEALALYNADDVMRLSTGGLSSALDSSQRITGHEPFYILFTSGSTGTPKGVVITCENLESFLDWTLSEQSFAPQREVFLDQAPFSFDLSVMDLYPCLATGGTLFSVLADWMTNPAELYRRLRLSGVTTWVSTPSFAQLCLVDKGFSAVLLPDVRRFMFCGETLSVDVASTLTSRFPGATVWNTYGPTEATVATTSLRVDEAVLKTYSPLPVGYPKPNSRIVIMDEASAVLGEDQHGQIVIVGDNVSPGYVGRPDLTERAFFLLDGQRAYRTGDQGYLHEGLLFFEGRRDHQIKLRGHRIEIGDIEANLQALPGVRDAIVVVKMKNGVPESLSAYVIADSNDALPDDEYAARLRELLGARIPAYMVPRRFYFLAAFPMTPNGKADRRELADMA